MSKITQNYIEARRDGIKWLNSQKRRRVLKGVLPKEQRL